MAAEDILNPFYVTRKEDFAGLVYCGYEEARTLNLINIIDAL
jgi:hypothetical protein